MDEKFLGPKRENGARRIFGFQTPMQTRYSSDRYSGLIAGFEDGENFPWEEELVLLFLGNRSDVNF